MAAIQRKLHRFLHLTPLKKRPRYISGIDVAYRGRIACAAIVTYDWQSRRIVEKVTATSVVSVPYMPGFFAFRELPAILRAYRKLRIRPDLLLFDAHGTVHPRRMGLATHAAIWLKTPAIGIAKKRFVGDFSMPAKQKGAFSPIRHKGEIVGAALRTREGSKPFYVSPGNWITIEEALRWTLSLVEKGQKVPTPLKGADRLSRVCIKNVSRNASPLF
jgi:deoxyribonuclease V